MAAPSVLERALQALQALRHDLGGALLYIDAGAAESLAAGTGLAALQDGEPAGAAAPVCAQLQRMRGCIVLATLLLLLCILYRQSWVLPWCATCPPPRQATCKTRSC